MQRWSSQLLASVKTLSEEALSAQFLQLLFSDRAVLPVQWATELVRLGVVDSAPRFAQWMDDLTDVPLDVQVVWTLQQQQILHQTLNFGDGTVYCFGVRPELEAADTLRYYFARPISTLDGYTTALLAELVARRGAAGLTRVKRTHTTVEVKFTLPPFAETPEVALTRRRLVNHMLLALLLLPCLAPDTPLFHRQLLQMLSTVQRFLSQKLRDETMPEWLAPLYPVLTRMHSCRPNDLGAALSVLCCPCIFCTHARSIITLRCTDAGAGVSPVVTLLVCDTVTQRMYERYREKQAQVEFQKRQETSRKRRLEEMHER